MLTDAERLAQAETEKEAAKAQAREAEQRAEALAAPSDHETAQAIACLKARGAYLRHQLRRINQSAGQFGQPTARDKARCIDNHHTIEAPKL